MGLDMYLHKRVSRYRKDDGTLTNEMGACKFDKFGRSNLVDIRTQVGYWRKANAVHKWFVDNVCDGKDDCSEHYVDLDQLKALREKCMDVFVTLDGETVGVDPECKDENVKPVKIDPLTVLDVEFKYEHMLDERQSELAAGILPTQDGFFFGETEYNGSYLYDLVKTVKMIDEILETAKKEEANGEYADYYYEASW